MADPTLESVGYAAPGDVTDIDNQQTIEPTPLNLQTDGLKRWKSLTTDAATAKTKPSDQASKAFIIDLLPNMFDGTRKACLKAEEPLAIKAAVSQTMSENRLFRPFHAYDKTTDQPERARRSKKEKKWPPANLMITSDELYRSQMSQAARFSHQKHAHFLWIRECTEGCDKIFKKKQGSLTAPAKDLQGFLQYNVFDDGVVVNALDGTEEVKQLLLFWMYLKLYSTLKRNEPGGGAIHVWGPEVQSVEASGTDGNKPPGAASTLYTAGSWGAASKTVKSTGAAIKKARTQNRRKKKTGPITAQDQRKETRALHIHAEALQKRLKELNETNEATIQEEAAKQVSKEQGELKEEIDKFTAKLKKILYVSCGGDDCTDKPLDKCNDPCTPQYGDNTSILDAVTTLTEGTWNTDAKQEKFIQDLQLKKQQEIDDTKTDLAATQAQLQPITIEADDDDSSDDSSDTDDDKKEETSHATSTAPASATSSVMDLVAGALPGHNLYLESVHEPATTYAYLKKGFTFCKPDTRGDGPVTAADVVDLLKLPHPVTDPQRQCVIAASALGWVKLPSNIPTAQAIMTMNVQQLKQKYKTYAIDTPPTTLKKAQWQERVKHRARWANKLNDALETDDNRTRWRDMKLAELVSCDRGVVQGICKGEDGGGPLFAMCKKGSASTAPWTVIHLVCGSRTSNPLEHKSDASIDSIVKQNKKLFDRCSRPGGISIGEDEEGFAGEITKYMKTPGAQFWETADQNAFMITSPFEVAD